MTKVIHTLQQFTQFGVCSHTVHTLFTRYDTVHTYFDVVHTLFTNYETVHTHFDAFHSPFKQYDKVHKLYKKQFTHTLTQ